MAAPRSTPPTSSSLSACWRRRRATPACIPVFAAHDDALARRIIALGSGYGWAPHEYEFGMLYGVRTAWQQQLRAQNNAARLYLPFGRDWWPYTVRRIGENPRNLLLLARPMLEREPRTAPVA
jgi:hypothetical protein